MSTRTVLLRSIITRIFVVACAELSKKAKSVSSFITDATDAYPSNKDYRTENCTKQEAPRRLERCLWFSRYGYTNAV